MALGDDLLTGVVNELTAAMKFVPGAGTILSNAVEASIKTAAIDVPPAETIKPPKGVEEYQQEVLSGYILGGELVSKEEFQNRTKGTPAEKDLLDIDITLATPENLNRAMALLSSEKDINRKLYAALAVNSIATQLSVMNMDRYSTQAQSALGIKDLDSQIAVAMQADMMSPANPRDGTHSKQTQELIDRRNALNASVPQLAQQYALQDPTTAAPLAASKAILQTLPVIERLDIARDRLSQKSAEINSITDVEAKNYASMTNQYRQIDWANPTSVFKAKETMFENKEFLKLLQTGILSVDDPVTARMAYAQAEKVPDKNRALKMMERMEFEYLGVNDPTVSRAEKERRLSSFDENMQLVQAAYNRKLDEQEVEAIQNQLNIEAITGKERAARQKELEIQFKEMRLQEAIKARFTQDVTRWGGMNYTDPLVQNAISKSKQVTGKSNVPLDVFVTNYLSQDSDLTYKQKLQKLKGYIVSSAQVANNSSIMPQLDGTAIANDMAPSAVTIWLKTILQ